MEDYDWCTMWYLQQQDDQQPYHGLLDQHLTDDHSSSLDESLVTSFLGFDPCQPFEPQNYPIMMTMPDNTYQECLANINAELDTIPISPSLHSHQQNYQILGVEDFNDFETWWSANLSILLYSDVTNAELATMDIKPLNSTTPCSVDVVPAAAASSAMPGNFNVIEDRESFTNDDQVAVRKKRQLKRTSCCRSTSSNLEYEEIQKYFHVPITKAAKELRVGVTVLKKRCRELDIARWPHRKIKSLNGLIDNVKELGVTNEEEIKMLEEHKRALEMVPGLELTTRTKKLRQACFKANYKKRRFLMINNSTPALEYSDC